MNTQVDVQCKLFYVDDDQDDLELFKEAAEYVGESVCLFELADEMFHALDKPTPHPAMIFVDLNMPRKDGFQVIVDVKSSPCFSHLPVIVYSTAANRESVTRCKNLGASLYVKKPTTKKEIEKIILFAAGIDWQNHKVTPENFIYKG